MAMFNSYVTNYQRLSQSTMCSARLHNTPWPNRHDVRGRSSHRRCRYWDDPTPSWSRLPAGSSLSYHLRYPSDSIPRQGDEVPGTGIRDLNNKGVKIEGPVTGILCIPSIIMYPFLKGYANPFINQPTNGKRTSMQSLECFWDLRVCGYRNMFLWIKQHWFQRAGFYRIESEQGRASMFATLLCCIKSFNPNLSVHFPRSSCKFTPSNTTAPPRYFWLHFCLLNFSWVYTSRFVAKNYIPNFFGSYKSPCKKSSNLQFL